VLEFLISVAEIAELGACHAVCASAAFEGA